MRRSTLSLFALIVAAIAVGGCSPRGVDAGFEGVVVRKPTVFAWLYDGGVQREPVQPGTTWRAFSTEMYEVDRRPQQFTIHAEDFMTSDGVPLDFDSVIRLRVLDFVRLIGNFGEDWFNQNVAAEFTNRLRQAIRKHGMNETAIETTAIDDIDAEVSTAMETYIKESLLPLELVQITVGRANPPDSIKDQRIATANQQQRKLTEQERERAEDQRQAAEKAAAAADNAYRTALGLTQEQFLVVESLEVQRESIAALRAQIDMQREVCKSSPENASPCTFVVTGASGMPPPVVSVR